MRTRGKEGSRFASIKFARSVVSPVGTAGVPSTGPRVHGCNDRADNFFPREKRRGEGGKKSLTPCVEFKSRKEQFRPVSREYAIRAESYDSVGMATASGTAMATADERLTLFPSSPRSCGAVVGRWCKRRRDREDKRERISEAAS